MIAARAGRVADALLLVFALALPLSIAVSEIALCAALVAWLVSAPWRRAAPAGLRALALASAAFAATWLLASLRAPDVVASLVNLRKLYSILLVFLVLDRVRDARMADRVAAAALVGGAASAAFGILDFLAVRLAQHVWYFRLEGVFSTAMTTGNVFATLGIAALGEACLSAGRRARFALGALVFTGLALLGTLTRSAWLAFLAGSSLVLAVRQRRILVVAIVLLAGGLAFGPGEIRDRVGSIFDPAYETNAGRISLWKSGLAVVRDHPWTGVGLADHFALIERYRRSDATFHAGHFHNNLVQVAACSGLLGLAAYLALMLTIAGLLLRAARRQPGGGRALVGLAVWIGFQVHGLFDWSFGDVEVVNQFYLWVALGLAAVAPAGRAAPAPGTPSPSPASA